MTEWARRGESAPSAEAPPAPVTETAEISGVEAARPLREPAVAAADAPFAELRAEVGRVIVGQEGLLTRLLTALLCDGHCLIEGVPGLAKSLMVSTLAACLDAEHTRLQFTPDLLPADLTGSEIYRAGAEEFEVRRGPIFTNVLLADEINRAPAKVQSALLEAMQERQVSIGGQTLPLPRPFLVLATQNPIEQEGTYPLPEAQLDRFMLKVVVDYPGELEEREILDRQLEPSGAAPRATTSPRALADAAREASQVRMEGSLRDYVVQLVRATRTPGRLVTALGPYVRHGASPRAAAALAQCARANAYLEGRGYADPDDVKEFAPDVLRHRIGLTYEAEADGVTSDDVIDRLLAAAPLP